MLHSLIMCWHLPLNEWFFSIFVVFAEPVIRGPVIALW